MELSPQTHAVDEKCLTNIVAQVGLVSFSASNTGYAYAVGKAGISAATLPGLACTPDDPANWQNLWLPQTSTGHS